ncbi:hypothetical protein HKX48_007658 [Thoreauomyces humboldtii]|nr:hypothetical protein HKX48_007658 [Thoreauomyces humboldtii]
MGGSSVFCAVCGVGFTPWFDEKDEKLKERHEEAASHSREQCMFTIDGTFTEPSQIGDPGWDTNHNDVLPVFQPDTPKNRLEFPEDKGWNPVVVNEVSIDIDDPRSSVPTIRLQRAPSRNIIEVLVKGTPGPPKNVLVKLYAMERRLDEDFPGEGLLLHWRCGKVLANLMAVSWNIQLGSDGAKELYLWLAGQCDFIAQGNWYHESVYGMQGQEFEVRVGSEWVTTNISVFPRFHPAVRPTPVVYSLPFLFPLPREIQRMVLTMLDLDDLATLTGVDKASRSFLSADHAAIFWNRACNSELLLWIFNKDMPSLNEENEAVGAADDLCCCQEPACGGSNKIDWMHYVAECRTSPNIRNRRRIVGIASQITHGFKGRNDEDDGASDEGDGEGIDKDLV